MHENIPVVPIPGPSAFLTALPASGLSTDEFTFGNSFVKYCGWPCSCECLEILTDIAYNVAVGFLPKHAGSWRRGWWLRQVKQERKYSMFLSQALSVSWRKFPDFRWLEVNNISAYFPWTRISLLSNGESQRKGLKELFILGEGIQYDKMECMVYYFAMWRNPLELEVSSFYFYGSICFGC